MSIPTEIQEFNRQMLERFKQMSDQSLLISRFVSLIKYSLDILNFDSAKEKLKEAILLLQRGELPTFEPFKIQDSPEESIMSDPWYKPIDNLVKKDHFLRSHIHKSLIELMKDDETYQTMVGFIDEHYQDFRLTSQQKDFILKKLREWRYFLLTHSTKEKQKTEKIEDNLRKTLNELKHDLEDQELKKESKSALEAATNGNMRVLILTIGAFIPSGVVGVTKQLIKGLVSKGIELKVISHWVGDFPYEMWDPPTNYSSVSIKNQDTSKVIYANFEQALKDIKIFRPDIIHVHSWSWADHVRGGISRIIEETGKPPVVFTLHSPKHGRYNPLIEQIRIAKTKRRANELWDEIQSTIRSKKESNEYIDPAYYKYTYDRALWSASVEGPSTEELFGKADKIITITDFHEKSIRRVYTEFADKFIAIHNVSTKNKDQVDRNVSNFDLLKVKNEIARKNEKLIVYIGRPERLKGVRLIGLAFNKLMDKNPSGNYKILGIGALGNGNVDRENFIAWSGIKKEYLSHIQFLTWKDNIDPYYKFMEVNDRVNAVLVMPIGPRGLLTVLEAATLRIPVIAWSVDERMAYTPFPKPNSLAKTIEYIFDPKNFELVIAKVNEAFGIVQNQYNINNYINQHINLYYYLIKDRKRQTIKPIG